MGINGEILIWRERESVKDKRGGCFLLGSSPTPSTCYFEQIKGDVGGINRQIQQLHHCSVTGVLIYSSPFCSHCLVSPPCSSLVSFLLSSLFSSSSQMEEAREKSEGSADKRSFRRICVFCGSRPGNKPSFSHATLELGKILVERKVDLVYGGGSVGLMGLISQTVLGGGCHVLGVIPKALMAHEISGKSIGEVKIVADMHERKSEMAKHADAFVALPGGYGTMEELLEMIAWSQLGIHEKPVGLLNVDGYYNNLLALFDKGVEEGFIEDRARHIVVSAETAEELIKKMEEYAPLRDRVAPRQSWEVDQVLESTSGHTLNS